MPKYLLRVGDWELDYKRMSETVEKRAYQKMRQAARIFLREAFVHVPVWTGEAIASLFPLAQYLHVQIPAAKTSPHPEAPENRFGLGMSQGIVKEPFIERRGWKFSFTITSDVKHFNINEFHDVSQYGIILRNPTPWRAFQQGAEAATKYLEATVQSIFPKFADFIIMKNMVDYA